MKMKILEFPVLAGRIFFKQRPYVGKEKYNVIWDF